MVNTPLPVANPPSAKDVTSSLTGVMLYIKPSLPLKVASPISLGENPAKTPMPGITFEATGIPLFTILFAKPRTTSLAKSFGLFL